MSRSTSKYFSGACANKWESLLIDTQYLLGSSPTQADAAAIKQMGALKPNPMTHPNLFAWAAIVGKFKESNMGKWKAGELP